MKQNQQQASYKYSRPSMFMDLPPIDSLNNLEGLVSIVSVDRHFFVSILLPIQYNNYSQIFYTV